MKSELRYHKTIKASKRSYSHLLFKLLMLQATQFGTKQLDEDGVLELIRKQPGKKSKYEVAAEADAKKVGFFARFDHIDISCILFSQLVRIV